MNRRWKMMVNIVGGLLVGAGLLLLPAGLVWLLITAFEPLAGRDVGMVWLAAEVIALGGGALLLTHSGHALKDRPSRPLRLPSVWLIGWGIVMLLVGGEVVRRVGAGGLLFPPIFVLAAAATPLAAVAWALHGRSAELTWRRFTLAFLGGATIAVALALVLELLVPIGLLALVYGALEPLRGMGDRMLEMLAGDEVARALSSREFLLALFQLAIVAPLVEEFVKPLHVLPLIRRTLRRREAFLLGAAAGAGFAALENLLYTGFGVEVWGGVLALRALGAAVHPLASGWVALSWHDVFHGSDRKPGTPPGWMMRFGLAVGLHGLWNGGSLLVLALADAHFFGPAPPDVDVLGLTTAGVLLALLAVVGGAAWAAMRSAGRPAEEVGPEILPPTLLASDRALAVWAVICLAAALSIGLATMRILGGGG